MYSVYAFFLVLYISTQAIPQNIYGEIYTYFSLFLRRLVNTVNLKAHTLLSF